MLAEGLSVRNWHRIVPHLEEVAEELSYASLAILKSDNKEELLRRYLLEGDDGREDPLADLYDEEEDGPPERALLVWLEGQIADISLGIPESRLRLRLYDRAGSKRKTYTLVVQYDNTPADKPQAERSAERVIEEIALQRAEREEETQGGFYVQMLDAMRQLRELQSTAASDSMGLYRELFESFSAELRANRDQINTLVEKVTSIKIAHAESEAKTIREQAATIAEDQRAKVAQDLGRQAIDQVGQLVGLLAMKQAGLSVDPQLAGVLGSLQQHPQFSETMKDPGVVAMLKDPGNVEYLAGWLKDAADAIKTSAGAGQDNDQGAAGQGAATTPSPEPGSPFDNHQGGNEAAPQ